MDQENFINLRKAEKEADKIVSADEGDPEFVVNKFDPAPMTESDFTELKASDKVKVKFDKFVNLIVNYQYEDGFDRHRGEDIIISADLLTDLASSQEEKKDRRVALIFIGGIVLGVAAAWLIFK